MSEEVIEKKRKYARNLKAKREKFVGFMKRTVNNIIVLNEKNVKDMPKTHLLACCAHRSHLDYLVLGLKIPEFGASQIRFAAGDNLTRIPFLGSLFRSVGAFSVYRGKSSQRTYLMQLTHKVKMIVANGDTVIVFPEGGRSYNGKMGDIKSGIISAGVLAQKENPKQPIYYLPCGINYTNLPDIRAFDLLFKAKKIRDNSENVFTKTLGSILYYWADIKVFLGDWIFKKKTDIYLNVGKPVALSSITDVESKYRAEGKTAIAANKDAINDCATWLEKRFYEIFPILPLNITAYLFKKYGRKGLREEQVEKMLTQIKKMSFCVDALSNMDTKQILRTGISQLKENGATGGIYHVRLKRKNRLDYFAAFLESAIEYYEKQSEA
ncbi:MAG: 1-acyl-sn-glycerol-3-phosphate acyltransferase [Chitinivibrionia bacterium]|nr:1-acyl-sn-glycerol-3-phosphate acyltransferase [Chitinivibrionia bacterium]